MTTDIHKIGRKGEKIAARFLRRQGYRVLGRNLTFGKNELDIVARDKQYIVFVEVKTRTVDTRFQETLENRPSLAVNRGKRVRTVAAAMDYLKARPTALAPRFDVVEVYLDRARRGKLFRINHIESAFGKGGRRR